MVVKTQITQPQRKALGMLNGERAQRSPATATECSLDPGTILLRWRAHSSREPPTEPYPPRARFQGNRFLVAKEGNAFFPLTRFLHSAMTRLFLLPSRNPGGDRPRSGLRLHPDRDCGPPERLEGDRGRTGGRGSVIKQVRLAHGPLISLRVGIKAPILYKGSRKSSLF